MIATPEQEAVAAFMGRADRLEEIRAFLQTRDSRPPEGSALAADDLLWPGQPVSEVAWQSMNSAWDHLDLIGMTVSMGHVYLTATFSVARGALLAACQALWILGPESALVRQQRALSVAREGLQYRIGWQTDQLKLCTPRRTGAVI